MKHSIASALAVSTFFAATTAFAADIPARREAFAPAPAYTAPVFTWTGFYVGLNTGYGWGKFTNGGERLFNDAKGGLIGATVGYNKQFGSAVLGIEGDWGWSGIKGSQSLVGPASANARLTNLMTLRGRAGYAFDRALIYGTAGYAGGTIRSSLTDLSLPVGSQNFSTSQWHNGYTFGAGLEYAFSNNISAKAEYLRAHIEGKDIFTAPRLSNTGVRENLLRAGVNYRF